MAKINAYKGRVYSVKVNSIFKRNGKSYKTTVLNTRLYGSSIKQVKEDLKKHYGNSCEIKIKYLGIREKRF